MVMWTLSDPSGPEGKSTEEAADQSQTMVFVQENKHGFVSFYLHSYSRSSMPLPFRTDHLAGANLRLVDWHKLFRPLKGL